ncbi:hypothetical protein V6N13_137384 [Hibiscus sabdariffa]|uniref:PGG domain-containing protein n=1 Tax=Hibiscus sabdariffa TaxID=183260 RepID=A0ABR2DKU8_9ROSI
MIKECDKDWEKGVSPRHGQLTEMILPSSPRTPRPALVLSNSGKALAASSSGKTLGVSNSGKSLAGSSSGKRFDKMYVKQVTGRHNDTELHLAAQRSDVEAIREILEEIDAQMTGTLSGAEFDAEVAEIRSAVVNEVNYLGETALFTAAEKGHLDVVKELLKYTTKEGIALKNQSGFDPLHIAANRGHEGCRILIKFGNYRDAAIVRVLLDHDPSLSKTVGQANATPLVSAAMKGHTAVAIELLSRDPSLLEIPKANGKNPLHFASRQGHVDIVKAFLDKDPQLARRTDKKGQTALHMAVKGTSSEVVRLLLQMDSALVMLPDKYGKTALHIATRKKRTEIVNELLLVPLTSVNALTRDRKTPLDIAEGLPYSEEISEIKESLLRFGAVTANDLNQPRDELRKTMREITNNMYIQLEQTRRTNRNVNGIAMELFKLHKAGINNATNSVTVVSVLFATVAFAAILTVPGGDNDRGRATVVSRTPFKIFFIFNAAALFISLAVVVVQITVVRGELKSERRVVEVINKLMWLAAVCTSISFISSSYIVVGRHNRWAAFVVTVIGGVIMGGVLTAMTYFVIKHKRNLKEKKKKRRSRSRTWSWQFSESDPEVKAIYAI